MYDITILIGCYKVAWETGSNFAPSPPPPPSTKAFQCGISIGNTDSVWGLLHCRFLCCHAVPSGSFPVSFSERLFLFSQPVKTEWGQYSTELFTEKAVDIIQTHDPSKPLFLYLPFQAVHSANFIQPLQAPPNLVKKFSHIEDENRRIFAAMVSSLDQGVGKVRKTIWMPTLACVQPPPLHFFRGGVGCTCNKGLKPIVSYQKQ